MATVGPEIDKLPDGYRFKNGEVVDLAPKSDLPPAWLVRAGWAMGAASEAVSASDSTSYEVLRPQGESEELNRMGTDLESWRDEKVRESEAYFERIAASKGK